MQSLCSQKCAKCPQMIDVRRPGALCTRCQTEKAVADDAANRTPDSDLSKYELEDVPEEVEKNKARSGPPDCLHSAQDWYIKDGIVHCSECEETAAVNRLIASAFNGASEEETAAAVDDALAKVRKSIKKGGT